MLLHVFHCQLPQLLEAKRARILDSYAKNLQHTELLFLCSVSTSGNRFGALNQPPNIQRAIFYQDNLPALLGFMATRPLTKYRRRRMMIWSMASSSSLGMSWSQGMWWKQNQELTTTGESSHVLSRQSKSEPSKSELRYQSQTRGSDWQKYCDLKSRKQKRALSFSPICPRSTMRIQGRRGHWKENKAHDPQTHHFRTIYQDQQQCLAVLPIRNGSETRIRSWMLS